MNLSLQLGVKTDPIEYRYSYEWLFRILADEGVKNVQIGTFFEIYQLPDEFFTRLRHQAESYGLILSSLFTAHRELGGFFMPDPSSQKIARHNFSRLIEIGSLLGIPSVGSNPGAVLRDQMDSKPDGIRCYVEHMKELMAYAHDCGVATLTIEPMSCLAEPPTLPSEMRQMAEELQAFHCENPASTAAIGYCADVAHGYADESGTVCLDNYQLLEASLPYLQEIHLKNTDPLFDKTFGFSEDERERGIVKVPEVRDFLLAHADVIPVQSLIGYLEISGPKLGRDYSDHLLERSLRASLRHLQEAFVTEAFVTESLSSVPATPATAEPLCLVSEPAAACGGVQSAPFVQSAPSVQIAPSMMCADMTHLADDLRRLEAAEVDLLHFDLMDGHFVPNMPLGLVTLEQLRPLTSLPFDVHLMVEDNDFFVRQLLQMGVDQISVHAESSTHLDRTLALIKAGGTRAGIALNPATAISELNYSLEQLDFVVLMTVNPGFAGQKMVSSALRKIADCRDYLDMYAPHVTIMVDGNVSFENIPAMVAAGADSLVCGTSSVFRKGQSYAANTRQTREAIAAGVAMRTGK